MRTAASPAQYLLSTLQVCECPSFAPPDWTCTASQPPFTGSHVKLYYINGEGFSGVVTLWSMSVCFILDTLWQSRGKQLRSNLWSTVRVLTLPLSSLFFVLLLFHSSHPSPLASQCDSIYPSWRGSAACLGGRCDEVKNFHTGVQILSGPVRDMAPHMHQDPEGTDLMRTPEWGYYNELFSVLALGKHTVTTPALLEVHRDLIFWPWVC